MKKCIDQVLLKIRSKAGAYNYIVTEILLLASAIEYVYLLCLQRHFIGNIFNGTWYTFHLHRHFLYLTQGFEK